MRKMADIRATFLATVADLQPLVAAPEVGRRWAEPSALAQMTVHADDLAVSVGVEPPRLPFLATTIAIETLVAVARHRHGDIAVLRALARRERDDIDALRVL